METPKCSLCSSVMTWKAYDNPAGGFWGCPKWKAHKEAGQKYTARFTEHPATKYMAKPEDKPVIDTTEQHRLMMEQIMYLVQKVDEVIDLLKQNLQ